VPVKSDKLKKANIKTDIHNKYKITNINSKLREEKENGRQKTG
jgi:hypothetical protein